MSMFYVLQPEDVLDTHAMGVKNIEEKELEVASSIAQQQTALSARIQAYSTKPQASSFTP